MIILNEFSAVQYGLEFKNSLLRYGHCETEIRRVSVAGEQAQVVSEIAAYFISERPIQITKLGMESANSVNYLCEFRNGEMLVLRENIGQKSIEYLGFISELIEIAHDQGAPLARPIYTMQGSAAVEALGRFWSAFEYLDSQEYFSGRDNQLELAGDSIGRLHKNTSTDVTLRLVDKFQSQAAAKYCDLDESGLMSLFAIATSKEPDSFITALFAAELETIRLAIHIVQEPEVSTETSCKGTIHFDLHPHNLIAVKKGIFIVDYDNFRIDEYAQDLGFALHRLGRQRLYHFGEADISYQLRGFLKAYDAANPNSVNSRSIIRHGLRRTLQSLSSVLSGYYLRNDISLEKVLPKAILAQREHLFFLNAAGLELPGYSKHLINSPSPW